MMRNHSTIHIRSLQHKINYKRFSPSFLVNHLRRICNLLIDRNITYIRMGIKRYFYVTLRTKNAHNLSHNALSVFCVSDEAPAFLTHCSPIFFLSQTLSSYLHLCLPLALVPFTFTSIALLHMQSSSHRMSIHSCNM